jgi:hypothetical protein
MLDARQADQLSFLIAGYWEMLYGGEASGEDLDILLRSLKLDSSDYVEDNKGTDEDDCLNAILGTARGNGDTIGRMLMKDDADAKCDLAYFGIKLVSKFGSRHEIFLSSNSRNLKAALKHTEFSDYAKLLKRTGIVKERRALKKINGASIRGFTIEMELKP